MLETRKLVRAFANLPVGWHYGRGTPISEEVRHNALVFIHAAELLGLKDAEAFPRESGDVEVVFYVKNSELAIIVQEDRRSSVSLEEDGRIVEELSGIEKTDAIVKLWEFSRRMRTTFDSFTLVAGPSVNESFVTARSSHHRWKLIQKKGSPSFVTTACPGPATVYTNTLDIFTVA